MIGINSKDALGLLEDLSIINAAADAAESKADSRESYKQSQILRKGAATIEALANRVKELEVQLSTLQSEMNEVLEGKNEFIAIIKGTEKALEDAAANIASVSGISLAEINEHYLRRLRSNYYNDHITDLLKKGYLSKDPRKSEKVLKRRWFIPPVKSNELEP